MKWIDTLEVKFGRFAVPGLLRYIALINILVFILYKMDPRFFAYIDLNPALVKNGEVWRLVTYIFIPSICNLIPTPDWMNAAFFVLFMWWMGDGLDNAWGPFKTNLFYLFGMIGTTIAAFFFGTAFSNIMLNSSLFFAFARFYPDVVIYMFFVLPMKIKWVAWCSCAWIIYKYFPYGMVVISSVLAALVNYLIFFGGDIARAAKHRSQVAGRRERFLKAAAPDDDVLHRCEVCKRTELSNPDLEFRVSADGHEYCIEHLPAKKPVT